MHVSQATTPRVRQRDVRVTRTFPSGAYECSVFVRDGFGNEWRKSKLYFGYAKRDAVRLFATECADEGLGRTLDGV